MFKKQVEEVMARLPDEILGGDQRGGSDGALKASVPTRGEKLLILTLFDKSPSPQNRQLHISVSNSKQ